MKLGLLLKRLITWFIGSFNRVEDFCKVEMEQFKNIEGLSSLLSLFYSMKFALKQVDKVIEALSFWNLL